MEKILHSGGRDVVEKSSSKFMFFISKGTFMFFYLIRTNSEGSFLSAGCFQGSTAS